MDNYSIYLQPTKFLDFDNDDVKNAVKQLTNSFQTEDYLGKAIRLFYFVRDEIKYVIIKEIFTRKIMKSSYILKRGEGFCVQKAVLFTSLCRAAGIPARLHFVDIRNYRSSKSVQELMGTNLFVWHGYTEMFLNNKWVKANPAFDKYLCQENNFPTVEFDGIHDAMFAKTDLLGNIFIEYEKDHGTFDELPYSEILNGWYEAYAEHFSKHFKKTL